MTKTTRDADRIARVVTLLLTTLAVATACASGPPTREDVRGHMFNNFWRLGEIQGRLIVGDLEGARRPARWLQEHISSEFIPSADPPEDPVVIDLLSYALVVEEARSVGDAARAMAGLAGACGNCHEETDGGPRFAASDPPPDGLTLSTHMLRHVWAADRMFEGLVAAGTERWTSGALALAAQPMRDSLLPEGVPNARALAERLHELGREAAETTDRLAWPALYGEVVETCATCHLGAGR